MIDPIPSPESIHSTAARWDWSLARHSPGELSTRPASWKVAGKFRRGLASLAAERFDARGIRAHPPPSSTKVF